MNSTRFRLIITLALVAGSASALAQSTPDEHAAHHATKQSAQLEKAANPGSDEQKQIKEMQNGATAMQALLDQVRDSKDPAERKKLLEQHHQMMVQQTEMMRHMGCGMSATGQGDMMQCHRMTEARMNMMATLLEQLMLEEMMEHVKAE